MRRFIVLLVLSVNYARGQLNFEGNPLTENTEYTAEESHYSGRQSKEFIQPNNKKSLDSYVIAANSLARNNEDPGAATSYSSRNVGLDHVQTNDRGNINVESTKSIYTNPINNRQIVQPNEQQNIYNTDNNILTAQITAPTNALNSFLNSQTPEESQYALDNYLRNHGQIQQPSEHIDLSQRNNQHIFETANQQQEILPINNQQQTVVEPQFYQVNHQLPLSWQQMNYQNRRDYISGPRRRPFNPYYGRYRGRPRVQPRIGHGYIGRGSPGPFIGGGKPPVEVIYTKPPGFSHGHPPISNPPVPYEDAGAIFPDSDHPPSGNDVYYSQLYSQSYDPHYYNYIAKTGKIKPWLYGKLGPKEGSGFWSELFHDFKKHGMKNMMNPMFLLGLSIPAVTLLLSAMVGKRSFARSYDGFSGDYMSEEKINQMTAKVKEAIECYEKNKMGDTINCWK